MRRAVLLLLCVTGVTGVVGCESKAEKSFKNVAKTVLDKAKYAVANVGDYEPLAYKNAERFADEIQTELTKLPSLRHNEHFYSIEKQLESIPTILKTTSDSYRLAAGYTPGPKRDDCIKDAKECLEIITTKIHRIETDLSN